MKWLLVSLFFTVQYTVKTKTTVDTRLVIQKILSQLNTKNDEVVELLPPKSRAPPQISLFEYKQFIIINKSNVQNWFAQQWEVLVLNTELRKNS